MDWARYNCNTHDSVTHVIWSTPRPSLQTPHNLVYPETIVITTTSNVSQDLDTLLSHWWKREKEKHLIWMLLNKLNVRYNRIPIMPMLKTRFSTHFEGFLTEDADSQRHFSTLGKPWENLEGSSGLNRHGACAARVREREFHSHSTT